MELLNAVLVIDDDRDVLEAAQLALSPYVTRIDTSPSPDGIAELMATTEFDCVLLDMNYGPGNRGGAEGMTVLGQIKIGSRQGQDRYCAAVDLCPRRSALRRCRSARRAILLLARQAR